MSDEQPLIDLAPVITPQMAAAVQAQPEAPPSTTRRVPRRRSSPQQHRLGPAEQDQLKAMFPDYDTEVLRSRYPGG